MHPRHLYAALLLCACSSAALAQISPSTPPSAPPGKPAALPAPEAVHGARGELTDLKVIAADPEDLGKLPIGARASRRLVFVHAGEGELELEVVKTTCGCTSASFSTLKLQPRETTELTVKVNVAPGSAPQQQAVTFSIKKNGVAEPQRGVVMVKYQPDWVVEITPSVVTLTVVKGETKSLPIAVRQMDRFDFPMETFDTDLKGISFGAAEPVLDDKSYGVIKAVSASVTGTSEGAQLGWIAPKCDEKDRVRPTLAAIRTILPLRGVPGGLILSSQDAGKGPVMVKLAARGEAKVMAAAAEIMPPIEGASVKIVSSATEQAVELSCSTGALAHPWGGAVIVKDGSGVVVANIPVSVTRAANSGDSAPKTK